jgi:site-specific recombinase XerD
MPKVDPKAILETEDTKRARAVAKQQGALAWALYEWLYTNGSRASEPGLAKLRDLDMPSSRVRLQHLKNGLAPDWVALATPCRTALVAWLAVREQSIVKPEQKLFVFPSANPGRCYPCRGTGKIKGKQVTKPCRHCEGMGKRWGLSRHEVGRIIGKILTAAGVPEGRRHPHVLRHSTITHLLDAGVSPAAIQERVGHKDVTTTFGYMKATKTARRQLDAALSDDTDDDK